MRRALSVLLMMMLAAGVAPCQVSVASSEQPAYANAAFGFAVPVPPGVTYVRTVPPNPDHGFAIQLTAQTKLWVDGSSTESASTRAEADRQSAGCRVRKKEAIALGGRPGVELEMACPATAYSGGYEERIALTVTHGGGRAPVCYQVGVRTDGGRSSVRAEALFRGLVRGFSFPR